MPTYLETVSSVPPETICPSCREPATQEEANQRIILAHPVQSSGFFQKTVQFFHPSTDYSCHIHEICSEAWRKVRKDQFNCQSCRLPLVNRPPLKQTSTLKQRAGTLFRQIFKNPLPLLVLSGSGIVGVTQLIGPLAGLSIAGISLFSTVLKSIKTPPTKEMIAAQAGAIAAGAGIGAAINVAALSTYIVAGCAGIAAVAAEWMNGTEHFAKAGIATAAIAGLSAFTAGGDIATISALALSVLSGIGIAITIVRR